MAADVTALTEDEPFTPERGQVSPADVAAAALATGGGIRSREVLPEFSGERKPFTLSPAERIRYLRREHARIEYPVACCRRCHQNWPCDVIAGMDAAAAAERDRIAAEVEALGHRMAAAAANLDGLGGARGRGEADGIIRAAGIIRDGAR